MPVVIKTPGEELFFRFLWVLEIFDLVGPGALVGSMALPRPLRTGLFGSAGEIRTEFFLNGIWGSGGWPAGGELREDSEAVNESFWDAPGVEIEAKQDLRVLEGLGGWGVA